MSLFGELKRRNVFRMGAAYVVTAWLIVQVVETIFPAFGFGDAAVRITTVVLGIGLIHTDPGLGLRVAPEASWSHLALALRSESDPKQTFRLLPRWMT